MGDQIHCPKCGCAQITANRRGFSGGAALGGDLLFGPIGLLAGTAGQNKIMITCLGCGFAWPPGWEEPDHTIRDMVADAGEFLFQAAKWALLALASAFCLVIALGLVIAVVTGWQ